MASGRNRDLGRILIVLAVLLLGIFLAFDISRPDSVLRSWFSPEPLKRPQARELIDALRRSR